MLKVAVVLVVAAVLARRLLPRYRLPWMVPAAVVVVILLVRTASYVLGEPDPA